MTHQLRQSPGVHAAIGLYGAGSMPEAVRMHRPGDPGVLACGADHLVDGEPGEGLPAFAGEDVWSLGLLFALQSLQPSGLVPFEVMGAVSSP